MNLHIDLTPTQRTAMERSRNFRESIAARAAELADRKANEALRMLRIVSLETPLRRTPFIQTIALEAMPAKTDPPSPNWFLVLASNPTKRDHPSIRDIQKAVCKCFDVKLSDMLSSRRAANIARPRQVAYYLSKEMTPHSLPQIGRMFGGRDHTTALWGIQKISRLRQTDEGLDAILKTLTAQLEAAIA